MCVYMRGHLWYIIKIDILIDTFTGRRQDMHSGYIREGSEILYYDSDATNCCYGPLRCNLFYQMSNVGLRLIRALGMAVPPSFYPLKF